MQSCVNDFTPLIAAIATLITVQFPVIITLLVNQAKMKQGIEITKQQNVILEKKTDIQTLMLENGYHGSYGLNGPLDTGLADYPGEPGEPGKDRA